MRSLILSGLFLSFLTITACAPETSLMQFSATASPSSNPPITFITVSGEIGEFFGDKRPRVIVLKAAAKGYTHILFDETAKGVNDTQVLSQNGCRVAPAWIQHGDTIEVRGRPGDDNTLIATEIRLFKLKLKSCQARP